jgi:hypothetical protein
VDRDETCSERDESGCRDTAGWTGKCEREERGWEERRRESYGRRAL